MRLKNILLILGIIMIAGAIYLFPKMINQRSYDKYFLYVPENVPESGKYPLILYLHGSGSRGEDPSTLEGSGPMPFLKKNTDLPLAVVSPICAKNDSWHARYLLRLIDSIEAKLPIDGNRIYVTGLSMGGNGTWDIARAAPNRFAAVAPVCARSPFENDDDVVALKNTPVWAFHGKKDDIIPFQETENLINKLEDLNADVTFTLYPDLNHAIWDETYNNPELYTWFYRKADKQNPITNSFENYNRALRNAKIESIQS